MEGYLLDVLSLAIRWLHVITAIAWVGASFYFVMLDTSLKAPKNREDKKRGVFGELWAVHGGGFYHSQKYLTGPKHEPLSNELHWSKWEAYTTWLTGISLLALVYWHGAEIYLIDPSVMELSKTAAITISIGFIVGGWFIYNKLCYSSLAADEKKLGVVLFLLIALSAWALCHIYSGRGAYMMFGAMLGTSMVANVAFVIIPGQRQMVERIRNGQPVDPAPGVRGKQRSVHNTYFTLPVLFTMISNHYAFTYGHEYNWLLLIGIFMAGALIRVYFVSRHGEGKAAAPAAIAAAVILLAVIVIATPKPVQPIAVPPVAGAMSGAASTGSEAQAATAGVSDAEVLAIISTRCAVCHSASPTQPGWAAAPKGIMYDSIAAIKAQAAIIYQQSVATKVMPIGNLTGMTESERQAVGAWIAAQK